MVRNELVAIIERLGEYQVEQIRRLAEAKHCAKVVLSSHSDYNAEPKALAE